MIFLAVEAPTPGRASRSLCEAVLRSTFAPDVGACLVSDCDLLFFWADSGNANARHAHSRMASRPVRLNCMVESLLGDFWR